MRAALIAAALAAAAAPAAAPALAQTFGQQEGGGIVFQQAPPGPEDPYIFTREPPRPESRSVEGEGARLRLLDKMNGQVETFEMAVGQTLEIRRLVLTLRTCRTPPADEKEDAFAYLEIRDKREERNRFEGWMIASSPALSALDHARYDVWVLSCNTDSAEASAGSAQKSQ